MTEATTTHQSPLSTTWRNWIVPDATQTTNSACQADEMFDAIVVGSGYGGSVAALRLAKKGYRVLLLERGSEYLPGDFPNDFSKLPKYLRANVPGQGLPLGRASGLFEITVGQGMAAITGNGLGGGSLINAGVVIEPDADVFTQDGWPAEIRLGMGKTAGQSDLDQAFIQAQTMLGAKEYKYPAGGPAEKTVALLKAGACHPTEPVQLTMDPDKCRQCGDCASGCNVPGAKGDLTATYLKQAVDTKRVQIITQAEVYRFVQERLPAESVHSGMTPPTGNWKLWVFSTDSQQEKVSRREAGTLQNSDNDPESNPDPASTLRVISTRLLVISAGTVGSTQLLQRSQALAGDELAFSPALGTRISGNGDSISVLATPTERVNAVGHGANPELLQLTPKDPQHRPHIVGPTITTSLNLRDANKPLAKRLLLQDGAIPGSMARLFAELLATTQTLAQVDRRTFARAPDSGHHKKANDPLAATLEAAQRAQVWLTMGHDHSPGRMLWMPGTDDSALVMPSPEKLETYVEQQALFDRLGKKGIHLHNPLWRALPATASDLMSGAQLPSMVTTVHPLGGCPMGDEPGNSVVNHLGQVWVHEPGFPGRTPLSRVSDTYPNAPQVYEGLYVLDGSIVPTSLGCNPLLTITALAERAMALALVDLADQKAAKPLIQSPARPRVSPEQTQPSFDVCLKEVLRGTSPSLKGAWTRNAAGQHTAVEFQATLATEDLAKSLAEQDHEFEITQARLLIARRGGATGAAKGPLADYQLDTDDSAQGSAHFHFLPATPSGSSGFMPLLRSLLELGSWVFGCIFGICAAVVLACDGQFAQSLAALSATIAFLFGWGICTAWPSTALTWLVLRGWFDLREFFMKGPSGQDPYKWSVAFLKQMVHSSERREMRYPVPMKLIGQAASDEFPRFILLTAHKTVMYRASCKQWLIWICRQVRRRLTRKNGDIPALRPTYWEQLMDAQVDVQERAIGPLASNLAQKFRPSLLRGELKMGFDSLFSNQTAQLGNRGDSTTGLLMLAGYALLAARFAIKTRLYDFRLPSYSEQPVADQASTQDTQLRWQAEKVGPSTIIRPELIWLCVPRGRSSSDTGIESLGDLRLRLWRYRRQDVEGNPKAPEVVEKAQWRNVPVTRVKSILLLHAFGQSGLSYTYKAERSKSGSNLAEAFYNQGYEVWVLDSRMSTRSGYAEFPSSVDMQGRYDVPVAVNEILARLKQELKSECPLQISVFGQCIGAASLWMALLTGRLHHRVKDPDSRLRVPKLAAAMFSQVHALSEGAPVTRSKTWIPVLLQKLMPYIPFAIRGAQDSMLWQLLDRVFSSMPTPEGERHLSTNEDGLATCRRIRFIEAPLFKHANMGRATIADMNRLFGSTNLRLFAHARRFVDRQRLVDEDGFNRYVTDRNLLNFMSFPVQLLHGAENELFDASSALRTHKWLLTSPHSQVPLLPLLIKGYGHLDVLLGERAANEVFPQVTAFFCAAQNNPGAAKPPPLAAPTRWRLSAPAVGPLVGWVRKGGGTPVVRVSFILDDQHGGGDTSAGATRILVRLRLPDPNAPSGYQYRTVARSCRVRMKEAKNPFDPDNKTLAYRVAWIDVQPNKSDWRDAGQGASTVVFQIVVLQPMQIGLAPMDFEASIVDIDDDAGITQALLAQQAACDKFNLTTRLDQLRAYKPLKDQMAFSVPTASWQAVRRTAEQLSVSFLSSCCRYPGLSLDEERIDQALLDALALEGPAFALMVGDQIYADATAGLIDPVSPVERYFERHATAFGSKGMHAFLSRMPTYMTPDDHEWVDNFPHANPLFKWPWPDWRGTSKFRGAEKYRASWARTVVTHFQRLQVSQKGKQRFTAGPAGPVRLFVLDTRKNRERGEAVIVSNDVFSQLEIWLQGGDTGKLNVIVSGSVVLPGLHLDADPTNPGVIDTWQYAPTQRQKLLELLVRERLSSGQRFLLLSGDYHVSAALEIRWAEQTVGAAVVVPPLYAPLPYANAAPDHLNISEGGLNVNGQDLSLRLPHNGDVRRGSGMAHITVTRSSDDGGFKVAVTRNLRVFETGEVHTAPAAQTAIIHL